MSADLNEQLASLASLRRYSTALACVEDFEREWRATMRDPEGRAALTLTYQQAQQDGEARGGSQCCGSTDDWHNPWCSTGPRRFRARLGARRATADPQAREVLHLDSIERMYADGLFDAVERARAGEETDIESGGVVVARITGIRGH